MRIKNTLIRFEPIRIKFEPKYVWIGLYWEKDNLFSKRIMITYKFYFCIVPLFPIIISFTCWVDWYNRFK